jgi:uncharacterized protein YkwD
MIEHVAFRTAARARTTARTTAVLALASLLTGFLVVPAAQATPPAPALGAQQASARHAARQATTITLPRGWRRAMLARVNEVRARVGLPPLRSCSALRRSAQGYASTMATSNHFAHEGVDGSEPWDRMQRQGYRWRDAAENIAAGQQSVAEVMDDWIASPEHYANLVNPHVRDVGFGFADDTRSTYGSYWVQNFGRGHGC